MSTGTSPEEAEEKLPVAVIAGPTASGKSGLAVRLALALREEDRSAVIINADSMQVYRDLHVLSARPSCEEMAGIPHRLFGAWDGSKACSAAQWAEAARCEIRKAHVAGEVPILCGGTGMYLKVLLEGIADVPPIDPHVRAEVRGLTVAQAYAALEIEDPQRAASLDPADSQRISRALEVVRSTGKSLAKWQRTKRGGIVDAVTLSAVILLPEREALYERCDRRFAEMIEQGAVAEVEALLARDLDPSLPVMRAIGVPEISGWLRGDLSREEAVHAGQQATRNYAKRQYTWFRRQSPVEWPRCTTTDFEIRSAFAGLF